MSLFLRWLPAALLLYPALSFAQTAALRPRCPAHDLAADPNRPTFSFPATPTQCGMFEVDFGFTTQSNTADAQGLVVRQSYLPASLRYGVTPRLDLRWGEINHIVQTGRPAVQGAGDEYLGARYMFVAQTPRMPALAVFYQIKLPTANVAKGLGTGHVDHVVTLLASKDLGRYHIDFNLIGMLAGAARGHDGALQGDLALTRAITKKASVVVEDFGGSLPGTPGRLGIVLVGGAYAVRPRLVLDTAYDVTYTAGAPHLQFLVGATYTVRPPWRRVR